MLIGIIADTHDNLPMIARAIVALRARRVDMMLHAGDFVAPFALKLLLKADIPLIGVFGNNDGERRILSDLSDALHQGPHRFELEGRTIVMAHEPDVLAAAIEDGDDLAVCGHLHEPQIKVGAPLLVNPGEAGAWLSGRSTGAVVDLRKMTAELVEFGRQEVTRL